MKKLLIFATIFALVSFKTADTELTKDERKLAQDELKKTKENFLKSLKGLSKEQLNFKSSPTSWSIAECAEHIAISENNLWAALEGSLKSAADPSRRGEVKSSDTDVLSMITSRANKVKTQEAFEPKGATVEQSIKDFTAKRDSHSDFVKTTKEDLRNRYVVFPWITLDSYQLILFMSGHTARHTAQIEEVKADPNYPKK
ncbi:MAG TPA: DinB family protein [Cyclobacteriaceae bacterium]|nr:DinB family protein [Cyclobacteriaceae bacterium]